MKNTFSAFIAIVMVVFAAAAISTASAGMKCMDKGALEEKVNIDQSGQDGTVIVESYEVEDLEEESEESESLYIAPDPNIED